MPEILSIKQNDSRTFSPRKIGETGEALAAEYLRKKGCRIVAANFKVPIGRIRGTAVSGEIDLIALDESVLCFVEVKTRSSDEFASPLAAVDLRKQRQIIRAAKVYRQIFQLIKTGFRYDAISIILRESAAPEIQLVKNFWTEAKFQKKSWSGEFW